MSEENYLPLTLNELKLSINIGDFEKKLKRKKKNNIITKFLNTFNEFKNCIDDLEPNAVSISSFHSSREDVIDLVTEFQKQESTRIEPLLIWMMKHLDRFLEEQTKQSEDEELSKIKDEIQSYILRSQKLVLRIEHISNFVSWALVEKDIDKIQQITGMKLSEGIFLSEVDGYERLTSEFSSKILKRKDLLFIIEETNGNLFGAVINSRIDSVSRWIYDDKAYIFKLREKGRFLKDPEIYKIEDPKHAFYLCDNDGILLFKIGDGDIQMAKKFISKKTCLFKSTSFQRPPPQRHIASAKMISNSFRFSVIQML